MTEYALVGQDGIIKAVIEASAQFISDHGNEILSQYGDVNGTWVLTPIKVGRGWTYANGTFTAPGA